MMRTVLDENKIEFMTMASILHPYVLPKLHASLFMLYTLFYKKDDDQYWDRIIKWNRHSDLAILAFLNVDKKFWKIELPEIDMTSAKGVHFSKGKFLHTACPIEIVLKVEKI